MELELSPGMGTASGAVQGHDSRKKKRLSTSFTTPTCIHPWSAATPPEGVTAECRFTLARGMTGGGR